MNENKCDTCSGIFGASGTGLCDDVVKFPVEEEKNDFISWIHRNRKALLIGACCVLSYRFGYRAGRAEALSIIDHAIREAKGIAGV